MAHGRYKDLVKIIESNKVLRDKTFKIASNSKYDGYERGLASTARKFLVRKNLTVVLLNLCRINNFQMNFISQVLEKLKDAKSILILKTRFGGLVLLMR